MGGQGAGSGPAPSKQLCVWSVWWLRVMTLAAPAFAQEPAASSREPAASSAREPAVSSTPATPPAQDNGSDSVSLERIREGLKKPAESKLRNLDVQADFSVQIEEQRRINEIMSKLDFKSGPAPAGGLYSYEQQLRLFNPTDRPLQQPYAAFSGGELDHDCDREPDREVPRRPRDQCGHLRGALEASAGTSGAMRRCRGTAPGARPGRH